MKYLDKQAKALIICAISLCILCIVSVSYSYFSTVIESDVKPLELIMGTMKLRFDDSTNSVVLNNAFPGDKVTKKFNVKNIGNLDTTYNIKVFDVTNTFIDKEDLIYTLTKDDVEISKDQVVPDRNGYIHIEQPITKEEEHKYELTIKFKKTEEDQNDNQKKKLELRVEIDTKEGVQLYQYIPPYKDQSGANPPELYEGMIPIYYDENNKIKIADITDKWYDYDEHKWGNAILIDNTNSEIRNKFYDEEGNLRINNEITEEDILQMYVWIPRYKYQLWNVNNEGVPKQIINIKFEAGTQTTGTVSCTTALNGVESCVDAENGNWYTHPAFTFGDTELRGIWVGKFEPSDPKDPNGRSSNIINEITILPDKTSMVLKRMSTAFNAAREIESNTKYSLNTMEIDTHLMKNIDWGAIAYLTQSVYGIYKDENTCNIENMNKDTCEVWINNTAQGAGTTGKTYNYGGTHTGCVGDSANAGVLWNDDDGFPAKCDDNKKWNTGGVKASTTGNMYGIYDMAGGVWESVMGVITNKEGTEPNYSYSEFNKENMPDNKYYDLYEFNESMTSHERGHLGDATKETLQTFGSSAVGWNTDVARFPTDRLPWFDRGGLYDQGILQGVFTFFQIAGALYENRSFRVVLTAQDGN